MTYPSQGPEQQPWNTPGGGQLVPSEDRNWALAAHVGSFLAAYIALGLLAPLVVLLVRGQQSPYVRRHAVESLNFQIFAAVLGIISAILVFVVIGIPMLVVLGIYYLIAVIMATVAASQGREFRYPVTVRLIK